MFKRHFSLGIVILLFLMSNVQAGIKVSMPTPRMGSASAVVDGKIYIIGGYSKQGISSVVEEYDSHKNKWNQKASMITSRGMTSAVAVGKVIYVIGGRNESGITNVVEAYDTVRDSWKKVKPMPTARWNHMVAEVDGLIYVIGGITGVGNRREAIDKVEIYDTAKDSWSSGIPMPKAKQGAAVNVNQEKIYILGGRFGAGDFGYATGSVEVYNKAQKTWDSASPMKKARTSPQAAIVDGKIFVIGGGFEGGLRDSIEVYNIASNTWDSQLTMQKQRTGHSVATIGNKIYIIGGATEISLAGIVGTVEELIVATEKRSNVAATVKDTATQTLHGAAQKKIGFTLVSDFDKKVPKANTAIFFAYYDPKKGKWERSSLRTDSNGRCSFMVPGGEQGESYTFLYATVQDEMDKAIKEVSDDKRSGWRIPPGDQQDLELLIDDGKRVSNTRGLVQMWGIRR